MHLLIFQNTLITLGAFIGPLTAFYAGPPVRRQNPLILSKTFVSSLPRSQIEGEKGAIYNEDEEDCNPLIPLEKLFGNLEYRSPSLSPDGKYIAYIGPNHRDGSCCYIYVCRLGDPLSSAKIVVPDNRIRSYFWSFDSQTILYYVNSGEAGSELYHLWAVDVETGNSRDLTPWKNAKAQNAMVNRNFPDQVLITTNARCSTVFDVYRCQISTGDIQIDTINPGDVISWGCHDETFEVCHALALNQVDSSTVLRVRDSKKDEWRDLYVYPYGDKGRFVAFCNDKRTGWITTNKDRDTVALVKINLSTGVLCSDSDVFENDEADIEDVVIGENSEVIMVTYCYDKKIIQLLDPSLERHYRFLVDKGPVGDIHEINILSKARNETLWLISYEPSDAPNFYAIYNLAEEEKLVTPLFCSQPALLQYPFAPMEMLKIYARDNVPLVSYLTRPHSKNNCNRGLAPLVLLVHGGPWERDRLGFNPLVQWLANRGYAVLQVNYRGSSGFGKRFMNLGDGQWGVGGMQNDLTDAALWCIRHGIAKEDAICIFGASYGGYACLCGLAFTPNLYKCGVSIAGPSDVKSLLDGIPRHWSPLRQKLLRRIGNVHDDENLNRRISPFYHIQNITAPLLMAHGVNDPRVSINDTLKFVSELKKKERDVELIIYPDEGHDILKPLNRFDFYRRLEIFLAMHLGGRYEATL